MSGQSRTIDTDRISSAERRATRTEIESFPWDEYQRPKIRRDCLRALDAGDGGPDGANAERPCPWVSCRYHLAIDVDRTNGHVKLNFPSLELDQLPETCALDIADRGGGTLEEVGSAMNVTRERIRQLESHGLHVLSKRSGAQDLLPLLGEVLLEEAPAAIAAARMPPISRAAIAPRPEMPSAAANEGAEHEDDSTALDAWLASHPERPVRSAEPAAEPMTTATASTMPPPLEADCDAKPENVPGTTATEMEGTMGEACNTPDCGGIVDGTSRRPDLAGKCSRCRKKIWNQEAKARLKAGRKLNAAMSVAAARAIQSPSAPSPAPTAAPADDLSAVGTVVARALRVVERLGGIEKAERVADAIPALQALAAVG